MTQIFKDRDIDTVLAYLNGKTGLLDYLVYITPSVNEKTVHDLLVTEYLHSIDENSCFSIQESFKSHSDLSFIAYLNSLQSHSASRRAVMLEYLASPDSLYSPPQSSNIPLPEQAAIKIHEKDYSTALRCLVEYGDVIAANTIISSNPEYSRQLITYYLEHGFVLSNTVIIIPPRSLK